MSGAAPSCPACGQTVAAADPPGDRCPGCDLELTAGAAPGTDALAPSEDTGAAPAATTGEEPAPPRPQPPPAPVRVAIADLPKGGFWLRAAAALVDMMIVAILQLLLGFMLGLAVGAAGGAPEDGIVQLLGTLASLTVATVYYVFFTGYGGQTPGKMAAGVRVVATDGSAVGFGRAFLREVIGKLCSGILLGIGYLMVAFDRQKQGLHDRIADTYVIKI